MNIIKDEKREKSHKNGLQGCPELFLMGGEDKLALFDEEKTEDTLKEEQLVNENWTEPAMEDGFSGAGEAL